MIGHSKLSFVVRALLFLSVLASLAACGRHGFSSPEADAAPSGSLIVHLQMDDDPADGAEDSSEYQHHAGCSVCPSAILARGAGAYRFDGTAMLEIPYDSTLAPVPGVTAAAWVQVTTFAGTRCIISKPVGTGAANSWQLCLDSDLSVKGCFAYPDIPPNMGCLETGLLQASVWHHVALTYDGDIGRVFIDGVMSAQDQLPVAHDDAPILVGGDLDLGAPVAQFSGFVDDVRVYNVALSSEEIAMLATP